MSRIYFHSQTGTAEVSGRERAHAGILCTELLFVALGVGSFTESTRFRKLLHPDAYPLRARSDAEFFQSFRTYLSASGVFDKNSLIMPGTGEEIDPWHASLNTAVAMGSDSVRLLAKLHAQCEIHAYVEGPHRAWLADVIEQGVKENILRTWDSDEKIQQGWRLVIDLLRSRDDLPVVTSYSVTEQFPNRSMAVEYGGWTPAIDHEAIRQKYNLISHDDPTEWERDYLSDLWYELSDEDQWRYAMNGLRKADEKGRLEIHPDTLGTQGYGNGLSGFDLAKALFDTNLD